MNFDIKIDFIKTHDDLHNNLGYDFLLSTYEAQHNIQNIVADNALHHMIHND